MQNTPENQLPATDAADWLSAQSMTAQGIHCGSWPLAFSYTWTHTIVEQFDLVPLPRAPLWLWGSINMDGHIVPVVDMASYLEPESTHGSPNNQFRLLVGGIVGDNYESAVAVLFSGSPTQIQYVRVARPQTDLPERLKELCAHQAVAQGAGLWWEIQTDRFYDTLLMDLMQL